MRVADIIADIISVGRGYNIIFETDRFNVTQPKQNYINECCYGDDAAKWLRERLAELNIETAESGQEDWGWYVYVLHHGNRYFVGLTGYSLDEPASNRGEWRFMIGKYRSLMETITGKNRMVESEQIIGILKRIIEAQPDMRFLGIEKR